MSDELQAKREALVARLVAALELVRDMPGRGTVWYWQHIDAAVDAALAAARATSGADVVESSAGRRRAGGGRA